MARAQWLQMHCQWHPTGDVRSHNSRTDSHSHSALEVLRLCAI